MQPVRLVLFAFRLNTVLSGGIDAEVTGETLRPLLEFFSIKLE